MDLLPEVQKIILQKRMLKMPAKQQKKLSSSVKVRYLNGQEIIKKLRALANEICRENDNITGIYLFGSLSKEIYVPINVP